MLLHTDTFTHTHRRFYTQTLLHTDAFTHRSFYIHTLLHTDAFTHRSFYTQTLLHTEAFADRSFYTQKLLHADTFTQRHFYTQTLLHTHRTKFLPQFLAIEPHFVRKVCAGRVTIAIFPSFWRSNLISCERVASDA